MSSKIDAKIGIEKSRFRGRPTAKEIPRLVARNGVFEVREVSRFKGFTVSRFHGFRVSRFRASRFRGLGLQGFGASGFQSFRVSDGSR